ncbi:MAG: phage antirepressor N-terminal domain-containing protein [Chloroflexales bacterium]
MTELVQRSVSFYGDDLMVIRQDGVDFTPVKPVCDILGIDWNSQYQRIMRDEVLSSVMCVTHTTGADGKRYEMLCLPLDFLNGWLFGVSANRIKPENRENLIRYKRECYRVLSKAFGGEGGSSERLAALEARIAALEAKGAHPSALSTSPVPFEDGRRIRRRDGMGQLVIRRITERIAAVRAALRQVDQPLRPLEITALLQASGLAVVPIQVSSTLWHMEKKTGEVIRDAEGRYVLAARMAEEQVSA